MVSVILFTILLVMMLLLIVQVSLSSKESISDPCLLPLESGFESLKYSSFLSSPFFILATLFVFFDMELILLLPGILFFFAIKTLLIFWLWLAVIVTLTLAIEWSSCGLKWSV